MCGVLLLVEKHFGEVLLSWFFNVLCIAIFFLDLVGLILLQIYLYAEKTQTLAVGWHVTTALCMPQVQGQSQNAAGLHGNAFGRAI